MDLIGKVFIGHGRSTVWKDLRDFLRDRLHLEWIEFNSDPVAGYATAERLSKILTEASFAFLVMTAEDERSPGTFHARDNVIHEVGLFQGRLGFARAIVLLEENCSEFSNIVGLSQIRFPKGNIMAKSDDIRQVLEREAVGLRHQEWYSIRFDYLPETPIDKREWVKVYGDGTVVFNANPEMPSAMSMEVTGGSFAMDHRLPPHAILCDRLTFSAKYSHSTMIFTGLNVMAQDGTRRKVWFKYVIGDGPPSATQGVVSQNQNELPEQTIFIRPQPQRNGWMLFDLRLPELTTRALGSQGWLYNSLWAIRLRGSVGISPITLWMPPAGGLQGRKPTDTA